MVPGKKETGGRARLEPLRSGRLTRFLKLPRSSLNEYLESQWYVASWRCLPFVESTLLRNTLLERQAKFASTDRVAQTVEAVHHHPDRQRSLRQFQRHKGNSSAAQSNYIGLAIRNRAILPALGS
jgi:hypothetical protein